MEIELTDTLKDQLVDLYQRSKQRDEWFLMHEADPKAEPKDVVPIRLTDDSWGSKDDMLKKLEKYPYARQHHFDDDNNLVGYGFNRQVHYVGRYGDVDAQRQHVIFVPRELFEGWHVHPRYLGHDRGRSRLTTYWVIENDFPSGEPMPTMAGFRTEGGIKSLELMAFNMNYQGAYKLSFSKKGTSWHSDFDKPDNG